MQVASWEVKPLPVDHDQHAANFRQLVAMELINVGA
jgi:hypothetical protein